MLGLVIIPIGFPIFQWFPQGFSHQVLLRALELGLSHCQGPSRCGVAETWEVAEELLRCVAGAQVWRHLGQAVQATPEQHGWLGETLETI